nr:PREDICTED: uncharacterized protein LOC109043300 [Bemisia tabaci]
MTERFFLLSIIIMIQQLLVEVKMAYVDQQRDDQRSRTNVFNPGYQAIKIGTQLHPRGLPHIKWHHKRKYAEVCKTKWKIFNGKRQREIRREGYKLCADRCRREDPSLIPFCHKISHRFLPVTKCDCYPIDRLPWKMRIHLWWLNKKNHGVMSFYDSKHASDTTLEILRRVNEFHNYSQVPSPTYQIVDGKIEPNPHFWPEKETKPP